MWVVISLHWLGLGRRENAIGMWLELSGARFKYKVNPCYGYASKKRTMDKFFKSCKAIDWRVLLYVKDAYPVCNGKIFLF